jgi:hypothetical protein
LATKADFSGFFWRQRPENFLKPQVVDLNRDFRTGTGFAPIPAMSVRFFFFPPRAAP